MFYYQRSEENSVSHLSKSFMAECSIAFPWFLNIQMSNACHRIGNKPVFDEPELFGSPGSCAVGPSFFTGMLNDFVMALPCMFLEVKQLKTELGSHHFHRHIPLQYCLRVCGIKLFNTLDSYQIILVHRYLFCSTQIL